MTAGRQPRDGAQRRPPERLDVVQRRVQRPERPVRRARGQAEAARDAPPGRARAAGAGASTSGGSAKRRLVWYSSVSTPPRAGGKLAASSSERTRCSAGGEDAAGQADVERQVAGDRHQLAQRVGRSGARRRPAPRPSPRRRRCSGRPRRRPDRRTARPAPAGRSRSGRTTRRWRPESRADRCAAGGWPAAARRRRRPCPGSSSISAGPTPANSRVNTTGASGEPMASAQRHGHHPQQAVARDPRGDGRRVLFGGDQARLQGGAQGDRDLQHQARHGQRHAVDADGRHVRLALSTNAPPSLPMNMPSRPNWIGAPERASSRARLASGCHVPLSLDSRRHRNAWRRAPGRSRRSARRASARAPGAAAARRRRRPGPGTAACGRCPGRCRRPAGRPAG